MKFGRVWHRRLTAIAARVRRGGRASLWARPMVGAHAAGAGGDLLRQQLLVLRRSVARPAVTRADRTLQVLLAGRVRAWRQALLIVRPETLLGWHRTGFRALWRRKSRPGPGRPPLPAETVALIRRMAGRTRSGAPSGSAANS